MRLSMVYLSFSFSSFFYPATLFPSGAIPQWILVNLRKGQHSSSVLPSITQPAALQGLPRYSVYSPVFQNKGSCVNCILRSHHQQGAESEFYPWLIWGKGPSVTAMQCRCPLSPARSPGLPVHSHRDSVLYLRSYTQQS